ncbi:MAG: nucleoid-associated protein [Flavobacteriales bacterium]|nr:nucleoid-associated protein [Flavobacteriales bacterium]
MVQGKEARVLELVVHHVGNGAEESVFNDYSAVLNGDEEQAFLRRFFLKPFALVAQTLEFDPGEGRKGNPLQALCRKIEGGDELVGHSVGIAKLLEKATREQDQRGGDVFIVKFTDVEVAGQAYEALGMYKFEDKEVFLESKARNAQIAMRLRRGLGSRRPDLACLVVFTGDEPTLFVIDDPARTDHWRNGFIHARPKKDHVNSTRNVLEMTKSFITQQLPHDYEIPKADQIDLLNRSVQYFKDNTEFDRGSFAREVFESDEVVESFQRFGDRYQEERALDLEDGFTISADAVKRQARVFKSVLKLDKNFHIYIHGDRNKIERGVDEQGRKFYKIYYEQEL